ncbi:MAG TPA: Na/Pi symporter, partial [Gemmatales bacterium]|nr:Na/Pi symporter [Gemmatales bacterium]
MALFLYGIEKMSDGLRAVAGNKLKTLLSKLTSNRFLGVLTGAAITAVIQSSSLTTVLVVGFITAGLMTLQQSVGIILGANIGTTLTVQLAAFKITDSAWLLVALGFAAFVLGKRDAARQIGSVLMGLGLLFLALEQMTNATSPLRSYQP